MCPLEPDEADALTQRLTAAHGELIGGAALARCLGFRTSRAFQIAAQRGHLPFETFPLPGRRGRFARTFQVARWLAECGTSSSQDGLTASEEGGDAAQER